MADERPAEEVTAVTATGYFSGEPRPIELRAVDGKHYVRTDVWHQVMSALHAARDDGITVSVERAFATNDEQFRLHEGWRLRLPGFKPADPPGWSKHQQGVAIDLAFGKTLAQRNEERERFFAIAEAHGFSRPHAGEPWHTEVAPHVDAVATDGAAPPTVPTKGTV